MSANNAKEMGFITADGVTLDLDVYYVGLLVPAGRRAFVVYRDLKLTENEYTIEVVTAANGFTGGTLGYHSDLSQGSVDVVQSRVYGGVTPDGAETVHFQDILDAGSVPGLSRPASSSLSDEYAHEWTQSPMIKITRAQGGTPYRLAVRAIVYEESDE